jgi:hypothetical protein
MIESYHPKVRELSEMLNDLNLVKWKIKLF